MRQSKRVGRVLGVVGFVVCSAMSSGCIVWDINDNLVAINEGLDGVDRQLADIDAQLRGVNTRLEILEEDLTPLPGIERLKQLEAINASIDPIEKHLASLRKTIANIDATVPFLSITDDTEDSVEDESKEGVGSAVDEAPAE